MPGYGKRPWDELRFPAKEDDFSSSMQTTKDDDSERTLEADLKNIAKHGLFGSIIGGLTGAGIASIELIRDPKAMAAGRRELATRRMGLFAGQFGVFFAGFHGLRKTLQLYAPKTSDDRTTDFVTLTGIAGALTVAPIIVVPKFRFMTPYAVFLIAVDAINSITGN